MTIDTVNTPSAFLREVNETTGRTFRELRNSVMKGGPLDDVTAELIVIAGFLVLGYELPFKVHGLRLLRQGVDKRMLQQTALVLLGASLPLFPVAQALRWIDEISDQHQQETRSTTT